MLLPIPVQNLIDAFSRLPGIGPKTAARLAFFLLRSSEEFSQDLAQALIEMKSNTSRCSICFNITAAGTGEGVGAADAGNEVCEICSNSDRDPAVICVVEEPLDVLALERTAVFTGRYHVLQGALSPIEGIGPEDLKIRELVQRVRAGGDDGRGVDEVIIATNPSMEGDYTASYISQQLSPFSLRLTRLARGLPVGGDLEYADQNTLQRALSGRQDMREDSGAPAAIPSANDAK